MSFSTQKSKTSPLFSGTGFSSATPGGKFLLDPSIRGFENQALEGLQGAAGRFGGQISQLRESAFGNLPDYIESQLNPARESFAQQRGGLTQSLGQRGLGGSSFGAGAMTAQNIDQQRALADIRGQATAGGVGQLAGLSQQELQAAGLTPQLMMQIAQARTQRELAPLLATGQESSGTSIGLGTGKGSIGSRLLYGKG